MAMTEDKTTDLMAFCASEFSGFFTHMGDAIKQFKLTGRLPESAFDGSGPAAGKADAKPKIKRKPTAFNMFVKFKIEELKASGLKLDDDKNNNELFKLAVAEWTQLSDAQRKYYTDKFKADLGEEGEGGLDQLPGISMSVPTSPQSPDHGRAEPAAASNKRRPDAQSTKASNAAGAESSDQNGDKRPKKKKKEKKAA